MCLEKKTRALDAWANTKVGIYAYYAPVDKIVKVLRSLQKKRQAGLEPSPVITIALNRWPHWLDQEPCTRCTIFPRP